MLLARKQLLYCCFDCPAFRRALETGQTMMLGQIRLARGMYRDGEPVLVPDECDLRETLAQAVARLPQNIHQAQPTVTPRWNSSRKC